MDRTAYTIIDNVIYTTADNTFPDPKGVGHYYYNQMINNKDEIAQIDGYTNKKDTFGSLLQRSVRTALAMIDIGISSGDHISLCSYHHLDSSVPHIASYFTGTIMGAIDPTMSVEEAAYLLKQTRPKIIFTTASAVNLVEKVVKCIETNTKIVVFGETVHHTPFSKFLLPHPGENSFKPKEVENIDQVALIMFSSGTTGMPKGICYSHLNMLCSTKKHHVDVARVLYAVSTPYWSVFPTFLHLSIEFGFARILFPSFNANDPWTMFYHAVDMAFSNPLQMLQMVRTQKTEAVDLRNVKLLHLGGNPATSKQINEIKSTLPYTFICLTYSQTEVFRNLISFEPTASGIQLAKKYPYSVGTVVEGFCYKVVDVDTNETLGPNQVGELRIRSPSQFVGYFNQDSSECFDSDGWLKTGDLFYYNEDLCFYIVDRIKESFKYLHHHISPVEIESVILDLDSVEEAVVLGVPHETECNHSMAVVKLKPSVEKMSEEVIIKHVEEKLEDKKRLRGGVRFVDDIPKTVTGKINRFKLKKMILNKEI